MLPRAGGTPSSMAAGSLTRSGPGRSGRTSARRVQSVVHTGPIKLLGVQFGSKWVNVKPSGSKVAQVAPTCSTNWICKSRTWVSFTLRFKSFVRLSLMILSSCRLRQFVTSNRPFTANYPQGDKWTSSLILWQLVTCSCHLHRQPFRPLEIAIASHRQRCSFHG